MAILKESDGVLTAPASGLFIESGNGTALINGIRVGLNEVHYPGFDGTIELSAVNITPVVAASDIVLPATQLGSQPISGITGLNVATVDLDTAADASATAVNFTGTGNIPITVNSLTFDPITLSALNTVGRSGIALPENTTIGAVGSSIIFYQSISSGPTPNIAGPGVFDYGANASITLISGKGIAFIDGTRIPLNGVHYPITLFPTDSLVVESNSLVFYQV